MAGRPSGRGAEAPEDDDEEEWETETEEEEEEQLEEEEHGRAPGGSGLGASAKGAAAGAAQSAAAADNATPLLTEAATWEALRGRGAGPLRAEQVLELLRRTRDAAEVENRAAAAVWREPLLHFDSRAEARAVARGAPNWVIAAARVGKRMAEETQELSARSEAYEAQVLEAKASNLAIARDPLLQLLERLQELTVGLRAHLPTLHLARNAMDLLPAAPMGVGSPRHGPLGVGGSSSSGVRPLEFSEVPKDIRDPLRLVNPVGAAQAVGRRLGDRGLGIVEFGIELIEGVGRAMGLMPLVLLEEGPLPPDIFPDRPSPWVAVLETLRDGVGRCRREVGRLPCFAGILRPPRLTTGYWKFRGLGAPMRMMCAYSGVQWEDIKYEVEKSASGSWIATQWEQFDRPDLKDRNALAQLPYVVNQTTGEVVSQSTAVSLYLGRVLGLLGPTKRTRIADEQALFYVHAMWMEVRDRVYPFRQFASEEEFRKSLDTYFNHTIPGHYEKLETWLRQRGTGFFAGWNPCVSDFHVWEVLDQHELMAKAYQYSSPLADFEHLQEFHQYFRYMPRLQAYFASKDAKLPVNNKMAFFK